MRNILIGMVVAVVLALTVDVWLHANSIWSFMYVMASVLAIGVLFNNSDEELDEAIRQFKEEMKSE